MSDYAWFRLIVRAIGIFLLAHAIPRFLDVMRWALEFWMYGESRMFTTSGFVSQLVLVGVDMAIALYLLVKGRRLIDFCMRDMRDRCPKCGYPAAGVTGSVCPECGTRFAFQPGSTNTAASEPGASA
jgi:hypothetical protein